MDSTKETVLNVGEIWREKSGTDPNPNEEAMMWAWEVRHGTTTMTAAAANETNEQPPRPIIYRSRKNHDGSKMDSRRYLSEIIRLHLALVGDGAGTKINIVSKGGICNDHQRLVNKGQYKI
jgi:hypothetical protein